MALGRRSATLLSSPSPSLRERQSLFKFSARAHPYENGPRWWAPKVMGSQLVSAARARGERWHRIGVLRSLGALWVPLLLIGCAFFLGAASWRQMGSFPTGLDAGNWFAIGRTLIGDQGKSTASAYPPLVPVLLVSARAIADPMAATKVVAIASLLTVAGSVALVTRSSTRWAAAASAAALLALSGPINEAVAYGGYPQNFALAFMVAGLWFLADYLDRGKRRSQAAAAVFLSFVAATHHAYFVLSVASGAFVISIALIAPGHRARRARVAGALMALIIAALISLPTLVRLRLDGYRPPVNATHVDLYGALRYSFLGALWFWIAVTAVGGVAAVGFLRYRYSAAVAAAAGLWLAGAVTLIATNEPRVVPVILIGSVISLAHAAERLTRSLRSPAAGNVLIVALAVSAVSIAARADQTASYFSYYRVMDRELQATIDWTAQNATGGDIAVRSSSRGWPIGWWFEGLSGRYVLVGSNPQWLGFPEERRNALIVNALFDRPTTSAQAANQAGAAGLRYLIFNRQEWIGWQAWLSEPMPSVRVMYANDEFMVLQVQP